MNHSDNSGQMIAMISNDSELLRFFIAEPQAVIMPFARDKEKRFICIVLFIYQQACNSETLASLCRRVVSLLTPSSLLDGLDGIEILFQTVVAEDTKRVLRFSVLAGALDSAKAVSADDLSRSFPRRGISCIVYEPSLLNSL
jgi:hypothetical protein